MIRLEKYHNGDKAIPTFSAAEMQRRQDMLRAWMAENEVDVVVFNSIHNINYFADFVYCAFGRNYALVVTQDHATTVSAGIDGGQPYRRTFGDNITYTDWHKDNFWYGISCLVKGNVRKVAIEFDFISVESKRRYQGVFPAAEIIDCAQSVMFMRTIKSDEEIALIKQSAQIGDIGGAACVEAIAEGVPEHEVALHSTGAMIREIARRFPHAELMDTWTWFQSGINTDGAHNPVTSRKLQRGDILSLNCFPMIAGYYTALERTLFCEQVSDAHRRLWEVNVKVHERGLVLIKPGAVCSEIAKELNEIYAEHDLLQYRSFGYGHSFGTLCHYYGREAGLELREDIDTVLAPNMVVSMEPMIMIPEGQAGAGGYREHDILVVGNEGAENITKFPYGPEHNIVKK
ncbi:MAG: creatininase [Gammaproteobacteria bacterium]|nr:MAG: creatininase [Gammaproteobacteria bacterium]